jgi:hypothetical protein
MEQYWCASAVYFSEFLRTKTKSWYPLDCITFACHLANITGIFYVPDTKLCISYTKLKFCSLLSSKGNLDKQLNSVRIIECIYVGGKLTLGTVFSGKFYQKRRSSR